MSPKPTHTQNGLTSDHTFLGTETSTNGIVTEATFSRCGGESGNTNPNAKSTDNIDNSDNNDESSPFHNLPPGIDTGRFTPPSPRRKAALFPNIQPPDLKQNTLAVPKPNTHLLSTTDDDCMDLIGAPKCTGNEGFNLNSSRKTTSTVKTSNLKNSTTRNNVTNNRITLVYAACAAFAVFIAVASQYPIGVLDQFQLIGSSTTNILRTKGDCSTLTQIFFEHVRERLNFSNDDDELFAARENDSATTTNKENDSIAEEDRIDVLDEIREESSVSESTLKSPKEKDVVDERPQSGLKARVSTLLPMGAGGMGAVTYGFGRHGGSTIADTLRVPKAYTLDKVAKYASTHAPGKARSVGPPEGGDSDGLALSPGAEPSPEAQASPTTVDEEGVFGNHSTPPAPEVGAGGGAGAKAVGAEGAGASKVAFESSGSGSKPMAHSSTARDDNYRSILAQCTGCPPETQNPYHTLSTRTLSGADIKAAVEKSKLSQVPFSGSRADIKKLYKDTQRFYPKDFMENLAANSWSGRWNLHKITGIEKESSFENPTIDPRTRRPDGMPRSMSMVNRADADLAREVVQSAMASAEAGVGRALAEGARSGGEDVLGFGDWGLFGNEDGSEDTPNDDKDEDTPNQETVGSQDVDNISSTRPPIKSRSRSAPADIGE